MPSSYQKLRKFVRPFIPPILVDALRGSPPVQPAASPFEGNYASWAEARAHAEGYESPLILEKAVEAALEVKSGRAPYERDTVVFDHIQYSFPLLAALLYSASAEGGRLSVLDFGGAFGSSYHQNKGFLDHVRHLRWSIVEQGQFVAKGRELFQNDVLRFYRTIDECLAIEAPNFVLLSGVLPYIENPDALLARIAGSGIPYLLVDRTQAVRGQPTRIVVQKVPPHIYAASYPCRIFSHEELELRLKRDYDLLVSFEAHVGSIIDLGDAKARYEGWFARLRGVRE